MKNDIDLTIAILRAVEAKQDLHPREIDLDGWDKVLVARHVERLFNDGMLDGTIFRPHGGPPRVLVVDLTSDGHAFFEAISKEGVWERLKAALKPSELGALSLRKIAGIAGELVEQGVRKKLGLD